MSAVSLVVLASESESANHPNPYLIGGVTLLIFLILLFGLLSFGKGRDHT